MILLVPTSSGTLAICQFVVPLAAPLQPNVLVQSTLVTPTLSEAVPLRLMLAADVAIIADPGERICTAGETVSGCEGGGTLHVIAIVLQAVVPPPSMTVKVTRFTPADKGSDEINQFVAPEATPDPPRSFAQVTRSVPLPPLATPEADTAAALVVKSELWLAIVIESGAGAGAGVGGMGVDDPPGAFCCIP